MGIQIRSSTDLWENMYCVIKNTRLEYCGSKAECIISVVLVPAGSTVKATKSRIAAAHIPGHRQCRE